MRHRVLGGVLLLIWRKTFLIVLRGIPSFLDESRLLAESERQSDSALRLRNGGRLAKSGSRLVGCKEIELGGHSAELGRLELWIGDDQESDLDGGSSSRRLCGLAIFRDLLSQRVLAANDVNAHYATFEATIPCYELPHTNVE